ncbi:hypothetical protein SGPA1_22055 [Streptomyces misionensis JCM 4497]
MGGGSRLGHVQPFCRAVGVMGRGGVLGHGLGTRFSELARGLPGPRTGLPLCGFGRRWVGLRSAGYGSVQPCRR